MVLGMLTGKLNSQSQQPETLLSLRLAQLPSPTLFSTSFVNFSL